MSMLLSILVSISLSMDAFSLAISLGMFGLNYRRAFILSLIVGSFHFFMPLLGSFFGDIFLNFVSINSNFFAGIIFLYISIEMLKEFYNDEHNESIFKTVDMVIFALGVSLDSFGVGLTMKFGLSSNYLTFFIFSLSSFTFTFAGLVLGNFLNKLVGRYATIFGALVLFILAITNFVNFYTFG